MASMWRKRRKSTGSGLVLSDDGYHDQDDRDSFRRGDSRLPLPTTDSSISSSSSWTGTVYHSHNDGASTGLFSWLSAGPAGWLRREGREEYPYEEQRAEHYGYARSDTSREDEKVPGGTYGKERVLVPRGRRPARSSRRFDTSNTRWYRRSLFRSLVIANCTLFALAYCLLRVIYIPQFSLKFDKRSWVETQFSHLTPPPPLHTPQCFDIARIERETLYNWTEAQVLPRRRQVNAGTGMNIDMTCYGAAKLVQPVDVDKGYDYPTPGWIPVVPTTHHEEASQETQRYARALLEKDMTYDDRHILPQLRVLNYHTYWRTDLLPFSERQAYTIQAFLATQPLTTSRLIMWTNSATILSSMPPLAALIAKFPHNIQVRQVDFSVLIKGTALEGNSVVQGEELYDRKGWIDGDAVRLLALYNFGGVWIDMDQVLTRDLRPLIEHEFLSQWDCEDKPYLRFNGALMHFRKHSPYLCEAFHIMASLPSPKPNSLNWGAHLYHHLHRRLLHGGQTPFSILPWCFTDPQNCRRDIAIPSPFIPNPAVWRGRSWTGGASEELEDRIGSVFSVHLHNQWTKPIPEGGWLDRLVQGQAEKVRVLELYQRWAETT